MRYFFRPCHARRIYNIFYCLEAIYNTKTPEETIELGEKLGYRLKSGDLILLFGDLGSGKTHFVKGIAKGLGINETIKSPTFAYVNKYSIRSTIGSTAERVHSGAGPQWLYHYDLYRLKKGDDISSLGFEETTQDGKAINVVEWADKLVELPDKYIRINFVAKKDHHRIKIEFIDPEIVPEDMIEKFYEGWSTPLHVRKHIKQVTDVAMQIVDAYIKKNEVINLNLLYSAAMMHDIARVCDFRKLDKSHFTEKITDEKWSKWEDIRKKYKGVHHANAAEKFFKELGFNKTAELIYIHKSRVIAEEPERMNTLEKKIMYYADKRVKHDETVSLKERFLDGWERYGKYDDTQTRKLFEEVEHQTFKLEKELFDGLDIQPEDV
jgi:tRNA threonylcarbamoyladenosine biosynthesis protein TsaE